MNLAGVCYTDFNQTLSSWALASRELAVPGSLMFEARRQVDVQTFDRCDAAKQPPDLDIQIMEKMS